MKIAFLTEMGFEGKIPLTHPNMRTEFAWIYALDAEHYCIRNYNEVKNYDYVFIIFPKGEVFLNSVGSKLVEKENPISELLKKDLVSKLKQNNNKHISYIQEGPHWLWNDYEIIDQINFYNLLVQCDSIFAHNQYDVKYYKGLLREKTINIIPTLMIEDSIKNIQPSKEDKTIIGGNFARWYGGFESYIVANEFKTDIWAQTSHAKRQDEDGFDNLKHLPRLLWVDWMRELSKFKYAVHLMPTVAAGTFSLNCAYFGIPCIGNEKVDTQRICHPELSVDVEDINKARELAMMLKNDSNFYNKCAENAKLNYEKYYSVEVWKQKIFNVIL